MNKFLSFLISLNSIILFAQKEHNIWYFNNGAGIDFNQNPPSLLTNGALTIGEPSTSICDINGQLLFYSNGLDIYNRQHQVMPNGAQLNGNLSSTQGALIVQKPNSTDEYFLFTNGAATWGPNGWQYNHVDMTLDNGLGDVVTKNQLISPSVTEKLCATHHSNGLDIWVLAHDSATNNFQRVLVTNAGVSPVTAVPIGSTPPFNVDNIGQMKFSASGDRIALNYQVSNVLELFDFDKTNGAITNHISLNLPINASESNYGLEFSTNGQYLYVGITNIGASVQGRIIQYDVSLLTATDILASAIEVGSFNCFMGSFQIAPDGKIYIAEYRSTGYGNPLNKIGVVNSPNSPGLNCNYSPQSFDLIGINSGPTLPNQVASYFFQAEILSDLYCLGDSTTFDLTYNTIPDSVEWDFGDPASIANNSILMNPKHLYSAPGVYNVQLISYLGAIVDTSFQTITISSMPLDLGNDTTLCGDSLILNGPNNWLSYQWSTGSDSSSA
ncbi:MAG: PKD domain-containing protein, partial [Flavobacteriales bacterium]|nr:PKD domain-containing protein [Flavobacteriales bacterium]